MMNILELIQNPETTPINNFLDRWIQEMPYPQKAKHGTCFWKLHQCVKNDPLIVVNANTKNNTLDLLWKPYYNILMGVTMTPSEITVRDYTVKGDIFYECSIQYPLAPASSA
jgi:hypothetical protein